MKTQKGILLTKVTSRYLLFTIMALLFHSASLFSQEINVQGTVISSEDKLPILGASVINTKTKAGTITNLDGNFTVKAKMGDVIVFSYIGMSKKEITVSKKVINVTLDPSAISLEEVVAIGYASVRKKELTGAVTQIKSDDIAKSVSSDLASALQGKVAGVNITSASGAPGSSSDIQIRGIASISGSNTPLFVVDGIPQEGDPRISTNEIQTIDILKDAASCAIYGTRGTAGVILITTKQGSAGKIKVSVSGTYGFQNITSSTDLLNAEEQNYVDIVYQRNVNNIADNQAVITLAKNAYYFQNNTDLSKIVFKDNQPTQEYSLNISGGSNNMTYNVVGGYYNQKGIVINSNFERYNARGNTSYKNGKWKIDTGLGFSLEKTQKSPGGIIAQTIRYNPYQPDFNPSNSAVAEVPGIGYSPAAMASNWVMESFKTEDNTKRDKMYGNINISYQLADGLTLSSRLGVNVTDELAKVFRPNFKLVDSTGKDLSSPESSGIEMSSARRFSSSSDVSLTYQKKFGNHKLTGFVGLTSEYYSYESFYGGKKGVTNNNIKVLESASATPYIYSGANWTPDYIDKLIGSIGRVQYDYKSRYLFSASVRRDGSSKFADENRWGYFPSMSGAWNIADESFWKPLENVVNGFKLRGSYGTTGNQSFKPYTFSATIRQGADYVFDSGTSELLALGSAQFSYANSNVKWETSKQSNIGADLGFFKNKLTFTADVYNTNKVDMLFPVQLPGSAGVLSSSDSKTTLNVGNMTNKGYELTLGYQANTRGVKWGVNGTFSQNRNEITKMSGLTTIIYNSDALISGDSNSKITALSLGHEVGSFFLNPTNGVANTADKLAEYKLLKADAKIGDLMYVDSNNDGSISDADRVYSGSGLPTFEAGLNFNIEYKGIDFNMQWYTAVGHEIVNGSKANAFSYGRAKELLYAWSAANPTSEIPAYRGDSKSHDNYRAYTDLFVEDGSYVRLKNVTLGYSFPTRTIKKIGLQKIRVYMTAQNPLTFTKYTGFDPEVGGSVASRGMDKANYPISSSYLMGLKLDF